MSDPAIVFDGVWKKFNRAQRFNSLRDLVPAMAAGLFCQGRSWGWRPPVDPEPVGLVARLDALLVPVHTNGGHR